MTSAYDDDKNKKEQTEDLEVKYQEPETSSGSAAYSPDQEKAFAELQKSLRKKGT